MCSFLIVKPDNWLIFLRLSAQYVKEILGLGISLHFSIQHTRYKTRGRNGDPKSPDMNMTVISIYYMV